MQLGWVPHQQGLRGFPRLHSASPLQSCPLQFDSVRSALLENSGQDLGLLPHLYPISLYPWSRHWKALYLQKALSPIHFTL